MFTTLFWSADWLTHTFTNPGASIYFPSVALLKKTYNYTTDVIYNHIQRLLPSPQCLTTPCGVNSGMTDWRCVCVWSAVGWAFLLRWLHELVGIMNHFRLVTHAQVWGAPCRLKKTQSFVFALGCYDVTFNQNKKTWLDAQRPTCQIT